MQQCSAFESPGTGGAVWGAESEELNATLVRWQPGGGVPAHINTEVDVVMTILEGDGALIVDDVHTALGPAQIFVIPKGASREVQAGPSGLAYLNVHKRRRKLQPNMTRPT